MSTAPCLPAVGLTPLPVSARELRDAFGCFPSGVIAVCAAVDGQLVGLAASSFTSVSVEPALVSLCIQHTSTTWPVLRGARRLGLSILSEGQSAAGRQLAAKGVERFSGLEVHVTPTDAVLVHGASGWLECDVVNEVAAGDHTIVVLQVHAVEAHPEIAPLVFHASGFRSLAGTA